MATILNESVDEGEADALAPGYLQSPASSAPASATATAVTTLGLGDFRCHRRLRLETGGAAVVLTGDNGSGKTSVLEAISLLSPGRGLRRARLAELAYRAEDGRVAPAWSVTARLRTPAGPIDVATGCAAEGDGAGERRHLKIDGRPARGLAALAETLGVLWITPEMDRVFAEGASVRRRFLDRLVLALDPAHARRLHAHDRAMQGRMALLRQGHPDAGWLAALEDALASAAVAIIAARRETALRLSQVAHERSGPFPAASLATSGPIEGWLDESPALAVEERLKDALAAARRADAEAGVTSVGAQRSDVDVRHATTGRPAAACSTGEQKMLLVAIVLASADAQASLRGSAPVLLLDEVAAHLDRRHRTALFERVAGVGGQAWYAGTDRSVFLPLEGRAQFIALAPLADAALQLPPVLRRKREGQGAMTSDD